MKCTVPIFFFFNFFIVFLFRSVQFIFDFPTFRGVCMCERVCVCVVLFKLFLSPIQIVFDFYSFSILQFDSHQCYWYMNCPLIRNIILFCLFILFIISIDYNIWILFFLLSPPNFLFVHLFTYSFFSSPIYIHFKF